MAHSILPIKLFWLLFLIDTTQKGYLQVLI